MIINYIKRYLINIKGQGVVEYALVLLLIVALAASLGTDHDLAATIKKMYENVSTAINGG